MLEIVLLSILVLGVALNVYGYRKKKNVLIIIGILLVLIFLAFWLPDWVKGFIKGFEDGYNA